MQKRVLFLVALLVVVWFFVNANMALVETRRHELMVKYGRQIPTAPIEFTIMWHIANDER